jgi:hypothetical protein
MLEKITKDFIKKIITEIKKQDNQETLEKDLINPILANFSERIFPYVSLLFVMYTLNLFLIIIILIILYKKNK